MKIISSTPVFNAVNNSFVYLCGDDEGNLWVRSSAGNWAKILPPLGTESVAKDFEGKPESDLETLKSDNKGDVIVPIAKALAAAVEAAEIKP